MINEKAISIAEKAAHALEGNTDLTVVETLVFEDRIDLSVTDTDGEKFTFTYTSVTE